MQNKTILRVDPKDVYEDIDLERLLSAARVASANLASERGRELER